MFSVLLSVYYNESPYYFRQSIDSLFNQSLQLAEVVLVKMESLRLSWKM